MSLISLHILKFLDSSKIQKFKYLENETSFMPQIVNSWITHYCYNVPKRQFSGGRKL